VKTSPNAVGAVIVALLGVAVLAASGLVAYNTLWEHGTSCAAGGGPTSCTPAGGWGSPAMIIIGLVVAVPLAALGVLILRAAIRTSKREG
jgi:predicted PurR-regulated permease PerM